MLHFPSRRAFYDKRISQEVDGEALGEVRACGSSGVAAGLEGWNCMIQSTRGLLQRGGMLSRRCIGVREGWKEGMEAHTCEI